MEVPREAFLPPPHVDSIVLTLDRREDAPPQDKLIRLRRLTRRAFLQRRKQMRGTLAPEGVTREAVMEALEALGFPETARPEELPPDAWLAFSKLV